MSRPTIRDVAREALVAVGTVSRVLNGSGPVRDDTAIRVRDAMDRLGFVPSQAGRSLRQGISRSIGVLVPTISNPIFARSLDGIELAAREREVSAVLMSSDYDAGAEAAIVATLVARGVDGLVLTLADTSPGRLSRLRAHGVPFVLLYNRRTGRQARPATPATPSRSRPSTAVPPCATPPPG